MDEIVRRGMVKWPNVPAVYGWLSLDRRGNWRIKGERVANPLVTGFIGRNYGRDERGCWFFQNGPQRVFVDLDYAPFVLRIVSPAGAPLALEAHTGQPIAALAGAWIDEHGGVLLQTELGAGTVHDRDLERLTPYLVDAGSQPVAEDPLEEMMEIAQQGKPVPLWLKFSSHGLKIETINSQDVGRRFGFVMRPEPPVGEEVCK